MRKMWLFGLLISSVTFGQTLVRKGGGSVLANELHVDLSRKQVHFKSNGKEEAIGFSELDSAVVGNKTLKRFDIGKKPKVYYVLASSGGKTLGIISTKRVQERGGFSTTITQYEAVVIQNGTILKKLKFNHRNTKAETQKRYDFISMIRQDFKDCAPLQAKMELFDHEEDTLKVTFLNWLDNPERISCNP